MTDDRTIHVLYIVKVQGTADMEGIRGVFDGRVVHAVRGCIRCNLLNN